jgi:hypothetical protein
MNNAMRHEFTITFFSGKRWRTASIIFWSQDTRSRAAQFFGATRDVRFEWRSEPYGRSYERSA